MLLHGSQAPLPLSRSRFSQTLLPYPLRSCPLSFLVLPPCRLRFQHPRFRADSLTHLILPPLVSLFLSCFLNKIHLSQTLFFSFIHKQLLLVPSPSLFGPGRVGRAFKLATIRGFINQQHRALLSASDWKVSFRHWPNTNHRLPGHC